MNENNLENNNVLPENNEEEDSNIVVLKDENGNDVKFEYLDSIEYENDNYVVLLPADESEGDEGDEVVILKEDKTSIDPNSDEESYVSVDDENILNNVFEIFKEKFKDEFDFEE